MPAINAMMSADYFSKLAFIYSVFDNPTFITMLVIMSVLFLLTVFFFVLFIKMVIKSREYTVDDPQNAAVLTLTALFLCVFLAKGKIIGHLGMSDAAVTPVVQLNEYAAAGPYKILHDAKQLNLSQIRVMKDRKEFLKNGLVTVNDEEKARQLMYRFTPKQEQ
jgi:hypothetical protein